MDKEKIQRTSIERVIKLHITSIIRMVSHFLIAILEAGYTPEVLSHPLNILMELSSPFPNSYYIFLCWPSFLSVFIFPGPSLPRMTSQTNYLQPSPSQALLPAPRLTEWIYCDGDYRTLVNQILNFHNYAKCYLIICLKISYTAFLSNLNLSEYWASWTHPLLLILNLFSTTSIFKVKKKSSWTLKI